jgi:lysyl-tRNA synthetase class II
VFDSEFERNLFELRKQKLAQIEDLGQSAYPNQFPASHTLPQVRAKWGDTQTEDLENHRVTVAVAGRLMAIRAQGKAGFATLQQAASGCRSMCGWMLSASRPSRFTSCWIWATTLASRATCSARGRAS